ncbi:MAG: pyruvate ferredoxin oxidoreductase [Candidatus Heimdallarchaeota archaeon]
MTSTKAEISSTQERIDLLTGNEAVAIAVKLARTQVVPAYPITPQTVIVEAIAEMITSGEMECEYIAVESEHSALAAAIGASLGGARTFTATSSHGLLYMGEMVFWAGMARIPIILANVNRTLNPWNIWPDHQDSMAFRDAGWIQMYAKNNQEVLDLTIMAFKIAEHHKVWLPVMVSLDGFVLSHTSSQVAIPPQETVDRFLPPFEPLVLLDPENPFAHGALTEAHGITALRKSLMEGMENAQVIIPQVFKEYQQHFSRWDKRMLEITGDLEKAKIGVMCLGTLGEEAERSVDYLTKKGLEVVSIRPRVFRPFPKKELLEILSQLEKVVIIDRAVSFGNEGQIAIETKALLFDEGLKLDVYPRIMGLGGADVNYRDIAQKIEEVAQ